MIRFARLLMHVYVRVHAGDRLVTPDNRLYKVVRVKGKTAFARFQGMRSGTGGVRME